jgi:hypothetical protein
VFAKNRIIAGALCAIALCALLVLSACNPVGGGTVAGEESPTFSAETGDNTGADAEAQAQNAAENTEPSLPAPVTDPQALYASILEELRAFPVEYDGSTADADGVCRDSFGGMGENSRRLLDDFIAAAGRGEAAELVVVRYTTEGDPCFTKVVHNGARYYFVADYSRDAFGGGEAQGAYDYLVVIDWHIWRTNQTEAHAVVLTDNKDLTRALFESSEAEQSACEVLATYSRLTTPPTATSAPPRHHLVAGGGGPGDVGCQGDV